MLVLTRKTGEEIVIDGTIRITVVSVSGDRVKIGIQAPRGVRVDRKEVFDRIQQFMSEEIPTDGPRPMPSAARSR